MTYEEALAKIASLQSRGWRLGLDRMQEFLHLAGLDDAIGLDKPKFIHVAGTNGKGSVTAFLQSLLVEQGWKAGATFSPYVYDVRERVQVGRDLIPQHLLVRLTEKLWPIADQMTDTEFGGPTEFEFKTALGFAAWKETDRDWVALEVGLGGRLDATNVVTPACSVIVSIGMDHQEILGYTLAKIATEKAGIIKQGVPVVIGEMPDEAADAILVRAHKMDSPVWRLGADVRYGVDEQGVWIEVPGLRSTGLTLGIQGRRQPHNLAVAVAAMSIGGALREPGALRSGAALASIPGRMERRHVMSRDWILDGAHNADAARSLVESLGSEFPATMLTGMLTGHDVEEFYGPFIGVISELHTCPIDFHRSRNPFDLAKVLASVFPKVVPHASVQEAVRACAETPGPILVTGSFYLVGEVGNLLSDMADQPPA